MEHCKTLGYVLNFFYHIYVYVIYITYIIYLLRQLLYLSYILLLKICFERIDRIELSPNQISR